MPQLSAHDATFLYSDTTHSNANVSLVHIYNQSTAPGGRVRFKSILKHIESRLDRLPILRLKLRRVPLDLDYPYWVDDGQFDLEYHVRHIALPKPGDWRQFCIQASRIHARALDLDRPLWEIYVIEGLDSITDLPPGSFALLTKIHHAAIDVESRNEFIEVLHDATRQPAAPEPPEPWFPERPPGAPALLLRAGLHLLRDPTKLLNPLRRAAPSALAFARDLLRPEVHPTATRFNSIVSPHRVFDTPISEAGIAGVVAMEPFANAGDSVRQFVQRLKSGEGGWSARAVGWSARIATQMASTSPTKPILP